MQTKRLRAGLYSITRSNGETWTVEERQLDGRWYWFASNDNDRFAYLDPEPTLRDAKIALSKEN